MTRRWLRSFNDWFVESLFDYGLLILGAALIGFVVLMVCIASAPEASHESTIAPDGAPAWLVSCRSQAACIRESAVLCPNGYDLFQSEGKTSQSTTYVKSGQVLVPINSEHYSGAQLIRCRAQ